MPAPRVLRTLTVVRVSAARTPLLWFRSALRLFHSQLRELYSERSRELHERRPVLPPEPL